MASRNLFEVGARFLANKLIEHGSVDAVYARGYEQVSVKAVLGSKLLRVDDGMGGLRIVWTDMDVLIPGGDLAFLLASEPPNPDRGDLLYITLPYEDVQTFEVFPMEGEPAWRWADPFRNLYRIHMKHVGNPEYP